MRTRNRLYLLALTCIVCIVILLSTDRSNQPFLRLSADDIVSFDLEGEEGVRTVSDPSRIEELAALLRELTVYQRTVSDQAGRRIDVLTRKGAVYHITAADGLICLDGTAYTADPAGTEQLLTFCRTFDMNG